MVLIDANRPVIRSSTLLACHYCLVSGRTMIGSLDTLVTTADWRDQLHCWVLCVHVRECPDSAADISISRADMYTHVHICVRAWAWHFHAVSIQLCWLTGGRFVCKYCPSISPWALKMHTHTSTHMRDVMKLHSQPWVLTVDLSRMSSEYLW